MDDVDAMFDPATRAARRRAIELTNRLSPRQRDVVIMAGRDLNVKETAEALGLLPSTVQSHRKDVLSRLHCKTIGGAVAIACRAGLL